MVVPGRNALSMMIRLMKPREFELHSGRGWLTSETALVKRRANSNDANGYYKALGLSPDATRDEIKSAYRRLAKKLHPDCGGDEELFRFVSDIASVLLNPESKSSYDSVDDSAVYLGSIEREELARAGMLKPLVDRIVRDNEAARKLHWTCLTTPGFLPGRDTDEWIELCREVSPAVGYRGRIQVAVLEGGWHWPCDPSRFWGVLSAGSYAFVVFQRGIEPNRLIALCAMHQWQRFLLNHKTERSATWL